MEGKGAIVMRVAGGSTDNGFVYHEHADVSTAKKEAHRLAALHHGQFVVYVPVAIIERTQPTTETPVAIPDHPDDLLPF